MGDTGPGAACGNSGGGADDRDGDEGRRTGDTQGHKVALRLALWRRTAALEFASVNLPPLGPRSTWRLLRPPRAKRFEIAAQDLVPRDEVCRSQYPNELREAVSEMQVRKTLPRVAGDARNLPPPRWTE